MQTKLRRPDDGLDPEKAWRDYLAGLPSYLNSKIRGQEQAIGRIARALQAAELGLNENGAKPKCSFLFLGPTGVGKTECAKQFTEYLFGRGAGPEIVFMNEYSADRRMEEFVSRAETIIRRSPGGTTLLFDEIEKAHPSFIDIFLSLLEEGQLTTLSGERVGVKNCFVVLTSNLGSGDLAKMESAPQAMMERFALDVAGQELRPELFARINERIVFHPLGLDVQKSLVEDIMARKLQKLSLFFGVPLTVDRGPVLAFLLRTAFNRAQGARFLQHEIDRQFNQASLALALCQKTPVEKKFYYDPAAGRLELC